MWNGMWIGKECKKETAMDSGRPAVVAHHIYGDLIRRRERQTLPPFGFERELDTADT